MRLCRNETCGVVLFEFKDTRGFAYCPSCLEEGARVKIFYFNHTKTLRVELRDED